MGSDVRRPRSHAVGKAFGVPGEERPDHLLEPRQITSQSRKEAVGGLSRCLCPGLPTICPPRLVNEAPQRLRCASRLGREPLPLTGKQRHLASDDPELRAPSAPWSTLAIRSAL